MFPQLARRTRVVTISVLAVAALGLTACSGPGGFTSVGDSNTIDASLATSLDEAISSAMAQSKSTEAIVGVWGSDGSEYVRAYGDNEELNGGSRFRGAQATQPVMCALLLDLVDAGTVDLDRKISEDLTRQVGIDDITYRQLCDMRSGLADFKGELNDIFVNNPTRIWPEQELIAQGLVHSPLSWPGKDVHLADTNASMLSRVLRVKTKSEAAELLDEHVFSKAGMTSSEYPDPATLTISGSALNGRTYPSSGGAPVCEAEVVEVPEVSSSMLAGAGATVTTVTDLKNFYTHYFDGTFGGEVANVVTDANPIQNPERDADGNPTTEPDPAGPQWAFGAEKQGPLYGNAGAITGTLTASYHDPESGYTVVIALNNSSAGAGFVKALAFELAAISAGAGIAPELPWTAEDQAAALAAGAICQ
ncbi:beta-lactamase family protein [Leucobacter insecticola]|uniref:Beta-lactamase family protein n=1 Tax=Leucobacter insecticola TaxID=2714934 RepID=A0A6G8FGD3_9MICO|nr:serine hydrolase domain-containing protein [Leucobacter insecticola]QIM15397.1 beta-lactamase family protein [Leucobacter insecticola]